MSKNVAKTEIRDLLESETFWKDFEDYAIISFQHSENADSF